VIDAYTTKHGKKFYIQSVYFNLCFNIGGYFLNRGYWRGILALSAVFLLMFTLSRNSYSIKSGDDEISVDVYIIALEGVETGAVDNISRVIEGVQRAVSNLHIEGFSYFWIEHTHINGTDSGGKYTSWSGVDGAPSGNYATLLFPVNASIHLISDWNSYKEVIETEEECIVVNAHGEVLPVPQGYSVEIWVDKIAEGLLQRNLTWIHVGGYPFYYYWVESGGMEECGVEGFQQLMKHINLEDIVCGPSKPYERDWLSRRVGDPLLYGAWSTVSYRSVTRDYPLTSEDLESNLVMNIWGPESCFPGAVVAFKEFENQTSFGFYVHIGTLHTYTLGGVLTDGDFWRAYAGSASGLWAVLGRKIAEFKLAEAESAIAQAREEGRTSGLKEASVLLEEARSLYDRYYYNEGVIVNTYRAIVEAENAQLPLSQPFPVEILLFPPIVGIVAGLLLLHRRRSNGRTLGSQVN
jgi:hypothetical protein